MPKDSPPGSRGTPPFETLTETAGVPLSAEGAAMMFTRYCVGARLAAGKRVLELGCGAGQGLGLIGQRATLVIGGDRSLTFLKTGRQHYGERFPLAQLTAEHLPFTAGSFDLVLFLEANYYVADIRAAFEEILRVLAPRGTVLLVSANPERLDFIRSPHSTQYLTAEQLRAALGRLGMRVTVQAAFSTAPQREGLVPQLTAWGLFTARRLLDRLGLVPRSLKGRAWLKRLVYGKLQRVPAELAMGFANDAPVVSVSEGPVTGFKVLYVLGQKP